MVKDDFEDVVLDDDELNITLNLGKFVDERLNLREP